MRDRKGPPTPGGHCMSQQGDAHGEGTSHRGALGRVVLVATLLLAYTHNQLTRFSLVYAVNFAAGTSAADHREFINVGLGFGPSEYALLASYGFTFLYALASLPAGRVADTTNRAKTLAAATLVWSLALAVQGSPIATFPVVWVCRVVQGLAMAFTGPQAISLLAESFLGPSLAIATGVYSTGLYLGGSLASLSILSNARFGYRSTFLGMAGAGVCLAALTSQVVEDPRPHPKPPAGASGGGAGERESTSGMVERMAASVSRVVRCKGIGMVLAATAVRFCAGFGLGLWAAPFFRAKFPSMQAQFSVINALTIGVGGCASTLAGGMLTERLARRDKRAVLMVPVAGCVLAVPTFLLAVGSGDFRTAMAFFVLTFLAAECWIGAVMCVLSQEVPSEIRGVATSMISLLTIVGNAAPLAIGAMVRRGVVLQTALAGVVGGAYALSAVLFFAASHALWGRD